MDGEANKGSKNEEGVSHCLCSVSFRYLGNGSKPELPYLRAFKTILPQPRSLPPMSTIMVDMFIHNKPKDTDSVEENVSVRLTAGRRD